MTFMDYYLSQKGLIVFMHDVLHPGSMCYFFGIHGDGGGGGHSPEKVVWVYVRRSRPSFHASPESRGSQVRSPIVA